MSDRFLNLLARMRGGIACPNCGAKSDALESGSRVLTCKPCGYDFSVSEAFARQPGAESLSKVDPDCPPADTKIFRCELTPGVMGWEVPPSGKSGGLMPFAVFWLGFIGLFTGLFLFGALKGGGQTSFFLLFILPFWGIGIGMLYAALRAKFAKHFIAVDADSVMMSRILFNRTKRKTLLRAQLESVQVKEFYRKNRRPVFGIEIRGADGKIRFGSMLSEGEKRWLVADLRRTIWPETQKTSTATRVSAQAEPALPFQPKAFTVDFPPVALMKSVGGPLIGLVVVGGFLSVGIFALEDAGFFRWLWLGMNSLFAVLILHGVRIAIRNSNQTVRVIGDPSQIHVQHLRHNLVVHETTLPRTPTTEARLFPSAQKNSSLMKVEILSEGEVVPVVYAYPERTGRGPFEELRAVLQGK